MLSWGGGFGNFLTGADGYLTKQIKPIGVAASLTVAALIFFVAAYNINFNFLLKAADIFKPKDKLAEEQPTEEALVAGVSNESYRDER